MVFSTAVAVAAYSTVMAETFAAVGLSTLIPAALVTTARAVNTAGDVAARSAAVRELEKALPGGPQLGKVLRAVAESNRSMDLLVPKTGKIHAEFAFEAGEGMSVSGSGSALVKIVTVTAGFSALYEASSKNKITMDVELALVEFPLVEKPATWRHGTLDG